MDNKPAIQTSATVNPIDISFTNKVTHVYVKVDEPKGLSPRFEGPYRIMSRPSRSQIQVRVGSFADGSPRLVTYNWQSCKPAHMREYAPEGSRPNIGRRPNPTADPGLLTKQATGCNSGNEPVDSHETSSSTQQQPPSSPAERGKFKRDSRRDSSNDPLPENRPAPHPGYVEKGPLITRQMFDQWTPELLNLPPSGRPVRTTRNPAPKYVDAVCNG